MNVNVNERENKNEAKMKRNFPSPYRRAKAPPFSYLLPLTSYHHDMSDGAAYVVREYRSLAQGEPEDERDVVGGTSGARAWGHHHR